MDTDSLRWRTSSHSMSNGHCAEVAGWRKSSRSFSNGGCTEVGQCGHGVAVRDSKDRSGPVLRFGGSTWGAFLAELKAAPRT